MMFPPARRRFSRTKPLRMTFPPVEVGGRKSLSVGARSKDTPRTDPSTVSCVPLRGTCLRRTPIHYIRSAHQCAGWAVYFAAAKYGKAGRPPGVAPLVAVRGLVPSGCIAGSQEGQRQFSTSWQALFARSKDTPRTDPSISDEMVPSTKPWMALPSGCIAGTRRSANSRWQGGWRRTHSVEGSLPK